MASEPAAESQADAPASSSATIEAKQVDHGYVFFDGQYLSAPYQVEPADGGVLVNGMLIKAEQFPRFIGPGRPSYAGSDRPGWQGAWQEGGWQRGGGRTGFLAGRLRRPTSSANLQARLVYRLEEDSAILVFGEHPLLILEPGPQVDDLLTVFVRRNPESKSQENVLAALPAEDLDHWKTWLTTYVPPPQLAQRAEARIAELEAVESANHAQVAAVQRIDRFSYPLSIVGMVLAVLAAGHLLKSVPNRDPHTSAVQASPQLMRFVLNSAALVFLLSALDLAWTLLASQAGQMRELNPLGRGLIEDPALLVAFKLSATLVSCGLLVALRRYHSAQIASWWLCLICTMLTFRWLMFNSMFMGS